MTLKHFTVDVHDFEAVKKQYRDLMKENHPDHGGNVEIAKEINAEFEWITKNILEGAFEAYQQKREDEGKERFYKDLTPFVDILMKIISWDVEIEIIGYWIYAFKSYDYRVQLKGLGFWFNKTAKAWVYNGSQKVAWMKTGWKLNETRAFHGSYKVEADEDEKTQRVSA